MTDTDALTERIARILNDEGWTFEGEHEPGDYDGCEDCRRAVDPVAVRVAREVAGEVRKAKAGAWDECEATAIIEDAPCSENFLFMVTHAPNPYRETGDQR